MAFYEVRLPVVGCAFRGTTRNHDRLVNAPVACTFLCIFGRQRLRPLQIGDIEHMLQEHMLHPVYPWSILRGFLTYRFPT